jgi:hypothetical protein
LFIKYRHTSKALLVEVDGAVIYLYPLGGSSKGARLEEVVPRGVELKQNMSINKWCMEFIPVLQIHQINHIISNYDIIFHKNNVQ